VELSDGPVVERRTCDATPRLTIDPGELTAVASKRFLVTRFDMRRLQGFRGFVFAAVLAGFVPVASAQTPPPTEFNFEDGEAVSGNLMRPDGEVIDVPRTGRRPSLIRIRESFIPEMLRSAENL